MQHRTTRIAAIALVAMAVLLAIVALLVGKRGNTPPATTTAAAPRTPQAAIPVVVATHAIAAGTRLRADDIKVELRSRAPAGSYEDATALVGQFLLRDLAESSTIYGNDIAHGVSLQLAPGERAIAVPVDEFTGTGHRIAPGEMVDVFLSLQAARGEEDRSQARLLLPRLRVLSYGSEDIPQPGAPRESAENASDEVSDEVASTDADANTSRAVPTTRRSNPGSTTASASGTTTTRSAVLAVPVEDANRLLLGAQRGKLFLTLRHPGDESTPDRDLFPDARPVLTAQRGLGDAERAALASPDNAAYAGMDLAGLSGESTRTEVSARPQPASPVRRAPAVEIIRGH